MENWSHKHILTLANFSKSDYHTVFDLAERFNSLIMSGTKKIPELEGDLITSLFFEPSTRTRNSFELATKRLSADFLSFSPSTSSLLKGETYLDTALTYSAMGSDILIIRHPSSHVPYEISKKLDLANSNTSILNAGDGLHSHPSQGLLDIYTLLKYFSPEKINFEALKSKTILIIGDVMHSRVARSDLWGLTAFGANIILCGPSKLVPEEFKDFVTVLPKHQNRDPILDRGLISISRSLDESIKNVDAAIVLRLQKERMTENLLRSTEFYSDNYCLTAEKLNINKKEIPILHPGPINRGVEISSEIVDGYQNCLINNQVSSGIPIRMALLYLLSKFKKKT